MDFPGMHRKCRFLPFFLIETSPVTTRAIMVILYCPTEVCFLYTTQLTNPHVYNVLGLAVEVSWDAKGISVYLDYAFFIDQWALATTTTIAVLIVNCDKLC